MNHFRTITIVVYLFTGRCKKIFSVTDGMIIMFEVHWPLRISDRFSVSSLIPESPSGPERIEIVRYLNVYSSSATITRNSEYYLQEIRHLKAFQVLDNRAWFVLQMNIQFYAFNQDVVFWEINVKYTVISRNILQCMFLLWLSV